MMSSLPAAVAFVLSTLCIYGINTQSFNPSILQDSRDLPKVDGTFGFLYRTEDGIAHAAKGDSDGVIHGRFTYTDPTGLKVNYNYNAGSRVTPGYNYNDPVPAPVPRYQTGGPSRDYNPPAPQGPRRDYSPPAPQGPTRDYSPPAPEYNDADYQDASYNQPAPQYRPRNRPTEFRNSADVYQERRTRPAHLRQNEIRDYNYRN